MVPKPSNLCFFCIFNAFSHIKAYILTNLKLIQDHLKDKMKNRNGYNYLGLIWLIWFKMVPKPSNLLVFCIFNAYSVINKMIDKF